MRNTMKRTSLHALTITQISQQLKFLMGQKRLMSIKLYKIIFLKP